MADEPAGPVRLEEEERPPQAYEIPLGIVVARILVVSGMGIAGALAIFFLVGAIWLPGLGAALATLVFMSLMFAIERWGQ